MHPIQRRGTRKKASRVQLIIFEFIAPPFQSAGTTFKVLENDFKLPTTNFKVLQTISKVLKTNFKVLETNLKLQKLKMDKILVVLSD